MFGPSCELSARLAVDDVNARGGILGRRVRLHLIDAGAAPALVASRVAHAISKGAIDAVVGWHLSHTRRAVAASTAGRVPYIYTTFYEGGEDTPGTYMIGGHRPSSCAPR